MLNLMVTRDSLVSLVEVPVVFLVIVSVVWPGKLGDVKELFLGQYETGRKLGKRVCVALCKIGGEQGVMRCVW